MLQGATCQICWVAGPTECIQDGCIRQLHTHHTSYTVLYQHPCRVDGVVVSCHVSGLCCIFRLRILSIWNHNRTARIETGIGLYGTWMCGYVQAPKVIKGKIVIINSGYRMCPPLHKNSRCSLSISPVPLVQAVCEQVLPGGKELAPPEIQRGVYKARPLAVSASKTW